MSREAMEAVQDHSSVSDPTGIAVFVAIGRFVGPSGEPGWASYRTLADVAHCDKDTVGRWVGIFQDLGELSVRKEGAGRGTRMYYTINLPFDDPKHGGAGLGDNKPRMSPSEGDNKHGDNIEVLSQRIEVLSQQVELLSQQIELLSPLLSQNVPTRGGQKPETNETNETNRKPGEIARKLTDHPGVQAYVEITETWPGDDAVPVLVNYLGDSPDEQALEKAWQYWVASGYKRHNAVGVMEWYQNIVQNPEWTPGMRFNGAHVSPPVNGKQESADERARRIAARVNR